MHIVQDSRDFLDFVEDDRLSGNTALRSVDFPVFRGPQRKAD
jgi:hypothetical protein